jgi:pilus assembly protein CpaB
MRHALARNELKMSQNRILFALISSALIGLLAIFLAAMWLKSNQTSNTIPAVVASRSISTGVVIASEDIRIIELPRDAIPIGSLHKLDALVGRVTKINIAPGEVILEKMLNTDGSSSGLAYAIAKGMRAVSMNVNEISDVAGFILPGNYVDVISSSKNQGDKATSKILMERLLVLAVAQERAVADEAKPKVVTAVTLEVTPEQAEILDAARLNGTLSLALRNQSDGLNAKEAQSSVVTSPSIVKREGGVEVIRGTAVQIESGLRK